jgi:DNA polymerase-4
MKATKIIAHIDLDSFFVSVERLLNPELIGKAVIVGGYIERGVVSSCSYEARKFGVHSAMPIKQAMRLCPQAVVVSGSMRMYGHYSAIVTAIIKDAIPLYEKASIDEFFLDLSGLDVYFNSKKIMDDLVHRIETEVKLPVSYGISTNKLVAKIATGIGKPNGRTIVPIGKEKEFLAPISIAKIPGVGKKFYEKLNAKGHFYIRDIQAENKEVLERLFGKHGVQLWLNANGFGSETIHLEKEQKSISAERTFNEDTKDAKFIKKVLITLAERVGFDVREINQKANCIAVKIRYSNFETHTKQCKVPPTNEDDFIYKTAVQLYTQAHDSKLAVRLIGIKLSDFEQSIQMELFENDNEKTELYKVMDNLKNKFGKNIIGKAAGK